MTDAQILVTGQFFSGQSLRAIGPVTLELLRQAKEEIQILAYVITPRAGDIIEEIENAAQRGVKVTVVVNHLEGQNPRIVSRLRVLRDQFSWVTVSSFGSSDAERLHAKVAVADRKEAVIGSANLSWGGLAGNHEIGVLLEGEDVWTLSSLIDYLAVQGNHSTDILPP